ncbi:MAG: hypothetical protein ABWY50_01230 [Aeromicrobium sp.]
MSDRRGVLAEISWFQVAASVLAAVTAAWLASRLGVAGTLVGAAFGSFVVTVSSALYGRTLDKGRTLIVQTASGTMIQKQVEDGQIATALQEVAEIDDSPVERAEVVRDEPERRLRWKPIIITTLVVLALALAAITAFEAVTDKTLGGSGGTTIGDTFGGSKSAADPAPGPDDTTPTPTSTPTSGATTPAPSSTTRAPTPTPTPATTTAEPTTEPTAQPTAPAE